MKYRHSEIELREAVVKSKSFRQLLQHLNIAAAGGNYSTVKKRLLLLKIDTSHFKGQGWNGGNTHGPKRPLEDYLSNRFSINSNELRKRLIKEGIFKHRCNSCKLVEWLGNPIPLELHHKDGNHDNNQLINLELVCPNCHTLTDTYRRPKSSSIKS